MKSISSFKKIIAVLIVLILISFSFSTSHTTQNIDKLAYVIAIGLDVGQNNKLNLSIQLSKSSGSSSSSSVETKNIVNSIECASIESGLNLFNSYISRTINLSHCKVVVISEKLASLGISEYIYTLQNNTQMSPHASIIISKCTAKEFLDSSEPVLEALSSKYYDIAITSSSHTGFTENVSLIKFFSDYIDTFTQSVAVLGSTNSGSQSSTKSSNSSGQSNDNSPSESKSNPSGNSSESSGNFSGESGNTSSSQSGNTSSSSNDQPNLDSSYTAGQTPISSEKSLEIMGLCVFNGDKLVGELNGLETICHMIVSNALTTCNLQMPNPLNDSENIDLEVKLSKNTHKDVCFVNGSPYIECDVHVQIKILSSTENSSSKNSDYYNSENTKLIEESFNEYLSNIIYSYLYKTCKEYKSDIDSFGKYAVKYFSTLDEWKEYDWLSNFENSFFKVSVDSTLKSGYSFI